MKSAFRDRVGDAKLLIETDTRGRDGTLTLACRAPSFRSVHSCGVAEARGVSHQVFHSDFLVAEPAASHVVRALLVVPRHVEQAAHVAATRASVPAKNRCFRDEIQRISIDPRKSPGRTVERAVRLLAIQALRAECVPARLARVQTRGHHPTERAARQRWHGRYELDPPTLHVF